MSFSKTERETKTKPYQTNYYNPFTRLINLLRTGFAEQFDIFLDDCPQAG